MRRNARPCRPTGRSSDWNSVQKRSHDKMCVVVRRRTHTRSLLPSFPHSPSHSRGSPMEGGIRFVFGRIPRDWRMRPKTPFDQYSSDTRHRWGGRMGRLRRVRAPFRGFVGCHHRLRDLAVHILISARGGCWKHDGLGVVGFAQGAQHVEVLVKQHLIWSTIPLAISRR